MRLGTVAALSSTAAAGLPDLTAYAGDTTRPHLVFRITSSQVTESSSLAVSTVDPSLVYTTNDSGDRGTVYTLDTSTGAVVGRTTLAGADPLDVEAIAAVSDGSLVVADIGDNTASHSTADLYRIEQPGRGDRAVTPDRVDLTYPGGPRDAESVVYDVSADRAFVVSKALGDGAVYATPPNVFEHEQARLRRVASAPPLATDATFLRGGGFVVIRTYVYATVYAYPSWEPVATFGLPAQQQGESITAPPSGDVVWVGHEGARSGVLEVSLPDLPAASPSAPQGATSAAPSPAGTNDQGAAGSDGTGTSDGSSGSESSAQRLAQVVFVISAAALVAILLGLLVVVGLRRPRR